jgi:methyl-accepting chemotaxis protein PixJ
MTTAKPFSYSETPNHSNGASVPPPPPSAKARLKATKRHQFTPPPERTPDPDKSNPKTSAKSGSTKASTLRSRLLLTLLPVTILPLAIISAVDYWITRDRVHTAEEDYLQNEAIVGSDLSSVFIEELRMNAELIGINPALQQALQSADQEVATKKLTQVPAERLEQYYGGSKQLLPDANLNTYLQQVAETAGLEEVFVTNRDGFNVAYSNLTSDFVQNDEAWWQGAHKDGSFVESPEYDESAGTHVLALATAIQDPTTAEVLGVIKSGASLAGLNNRLVEFLVTVKESNQIQLVDSTTGQLVASIKSGEDGLAVAVPSSELADQTVVGGKIITKIATAMQAAAATEQSPEQLVAALEEFDNLGESRVKRLTRQDGNVLVAEFNDGPKHYAMATVPNLPWVAISSIDTAELKEAQNDILKKFLIIGGILSAAAIASILYLARQVASPINQLADTANQVADGDLNVTVAEVGTLETRQLAGTFNNLVKQVKNLLSLQQNETDRAESLASIARAKSDSDMLAPLNKYLDEVRTKLAADRVVVYRFKPDLTGYIAGEAVLPDFPAALGDTISDPCIPQTLIDAYQQGRVVPTDDVMNSGFHPDHQQLMVRLQIKSNLVVPIQVAGELYGLLVAHHCTQLHTWQPEEISMLQLEAQRLGLAMGSLAALETQMFTAAEQERRRQSLETQILSMMTRIEGAADGDLTARAQLMEGEIGIVADLFNAVIENLQEIAIQVRDSSGQVNQSLNQNEAAIRELAEKAILEAKDIQTALGSVQTMSQAIETVAHNAEEASTIANSAYETVQAGNQAMDQTVSSILGLRTTMGDTTKKMKRLGESAQKISQVVSLIDELALKTNLLSINASVEAARAGELGQGFTAVAEQVGALAEQSAAATKEIAKIVTSIQSETQELVAAMEQGTTQVVDSTHQVETTKRRLTEVLGRSQEIDQLMRAISESAIAQAASAQSVTTVMEQVTQASKQRSMESREVAQAMQTTAQVSQKLQASVEQFKVD